MKMSSKEEQSRILTESNLVFRSLLKLFSTNSLLSLYNLRLEGAFDICDFEMTAVNLRKSDI